MAFKVGDDVAIFTRGNRTLSHLGKIAVVIPAMHDPIREVRRALGIGVRGIRIHKSKRDFMPLRDEESYVVSYMQGGYLAYTWPMTKHLEAVANG